MLINNLLKMRRRIVRTPNTLVDNKVTDKEFCTSTVIFAVLIEVFSIIQQMCF